MNIDANGSTFNVRIDGEQGPWVMLSHGLATDITMWDELTDSLKGHYRVVRYEARGHGASAGPAGDYTLDQLVDDAASILDAMKIEHTLFAGLSMGGMVGLGLMIRHPRKIKGAVIADSRHTTTPDFTKAWLDRIEMVRKGGVEAIVASTVSRWSSEGLAARNPAVVARMEKMVRGTSPNGYCGCASALARLNYGPRLNEINVPVLVICGDEDHGAPPENSRQMAAMVKGARFVEIKQAGHIANIEQPAAFNTAVSEFFDAIR